MGVVIVLTLLLVNGWILFVTFRRLFTRRVGITWWLVLCILVVAGANLGYQLGFEFEYNISPDLRIVSFPVPTCAFHLEHGRWVDFPTPDWFAYFAAFTDLVMATTFTVLPTTIGIAVSTSKTNRRRKKTENRG